MRITVSTCRKIGLPNYGSAGASCEVTIDVEPGPGLQGRIDDAYAVCTRAVAAQLARESGGTKPVVEPDHAATAAARNGNGHADGPTYGGAGGPNAAEAAAGWANQRLQAGVPRKSLCDFQRRPTRPAQLYPWAKKLEDAGYDGLVKHLEAWGRKVGLQGTFKDWPDDHLNAAVLEAENWAANR